MKPYKSPINASKTPTLRYPTRPSAPIHTKAHYNPVNPMEQPVTPYKPTEPPDSMKPQTLKKTIKTLLLQPNKNFKKRPIENLYVNNSVKPPQNPKKRPLTQKSTPTHPRTLKP